jgi:hypothetical protein
LKFPNTTTPYHFIVPETFALGHMHRAVKTIEGAWRHLQDGRGPALIVKHSSLTTDRAAVFQQVMHLLGLARVWNDVKADFLSNSKAEQAHAKMANPLFGTGTMNYRGAVSGEGACRRGPVSPATVGSPAGAATAAGHCTLPCLSEPQEICPGSTAGIDGA